MHGLGRNILFLVAAILAVWVVAHLIGFHFSLITTIVASVVLTIVFHLVANRGHT